LQLRVIAQLNQKKRGKELKIMINNKHEEDRQQWWLFFVIKKSFK